MKIYIDEAGRWPLAGPLYVGLIMPINISNKDVLLKDFKDSKQLSEKKREELYNVILDLSKTWKIIFSSGNVSNKVIDKKLVTKSINYAIRKWINVLADEKLSNCSKKTKKSLMKLSKKYWEISLFIDWKYDFVLSKDLNVKVETLVNADQKNIFVSMASIIAKVERDRYMQKISLRYPEYNFAKHKWYGTKNHIDMIKKYWVCDIHRELFLRNIL